METLIQRQVLAAPAASVTFAGIPQTYEDLILEIMGATSDAALDAIIGVQFNGDAGANYDWGQVYGNSGGTGAGGGGGVTSCALGFLSGATAPAGSASSIEATLTAYVRTVFRKTVKTVGYLSEGIGAPLSFGIVTAGQWRNTAAINSLTVIDTVGGNFIVGSVFSLYGRT